MKERDYGLGERIKAAMKAAGFKTAKEFCEQYNVPYLTVAQHMQGRRLPSPEFLKLYTKAFGVNTDWIETGQGSPLANQKKSQKIVQLATKELDKRMQLNQLLNKTLDIPLLTVVIEKLLKKYIKTNTEAVKFANAIALIYNDIERTKEDEKIKLKMVNIAVNTFLQHGL